MGQLGSLGPCWRPATQRVKCLVKSASCLPGLVLLVRARQLAADTGTGSVLVLAGGSWAARQQQRDITSRVQSSGGSSGHNTQQQSSHPRPTPQHHNTSTNVTRPSFDVQPSDGGADSVTAPGRG